MVTVSKALLFFIKNAAVVEQSTIMWRTCQSLDIQVHCYDFALKRLIDKETFTSQKSCTPEFPALFTDELLKIISLVVFFSNPRAQAPTTRHIPSGFLPDRILHKDRRVITDL